MTTPNPNAQPGTPDASWSPSFVDDLRQQRQAQGKWTARRYVDDHGPQPTRAPCCGRGNVQPEALTWVTPALREVLQTLERDAPAVMDEARLTSDAEYLCGGCLQKLRFGWKALGGKAPLDFAALYFALGAPPDVVERGRVKAAMGRDYGVNPSAPMSDVALSALQGRGFTKRSPQAMPPKPPGVGAGS